MKSKKKIKKNNNKTVVKKPDPLNSKAAVGGLKKLYAKLNKLKGETAKTLMDIAKKEAEVSEVLGVNVKKLDDAANETGEVGAYAVPFPDHFGTIRNVQPTGSGESHSVITNDWTPSHLPSSAVPSSPFMM